MTIVAVDDFPVMLDLLELLCATSGHQMVGKATNGILGIQAIISAKPQLALLDLKLPRMSGFEVISFLRQAKLDTKILVFSGYCSPFTIYRLDHLQIDGYISKANNSVAVLKDAIDTIDSGKKFFSQEYLDCRSARIRNQNAFDKILSNRELKILELLGDSLSDDQIAKILRISRLTVAKHRFHLQQKLDLPDRFALERYARTNGFVEIAAATR
jgi:two-component system nitrate/nitrite response regulator NarL